MSPSVQSNIIHSPLETTCTTPLLSRKDHPSLLSDYKHPTLLFKLFLTAFEDLMIIRTSLCQWLHLIHDFKQAKPDQCLRSCQLSNWCQLAFPTTLSPPASLPGYPWAYFLTSHSPSMGSAGYYTSASSSHACTYLPWSRDLENHFHPSEVQLFKFNSPPTLHLHQYMRRTENTLMSSQSILNL